MSKHKIGTGGNGSEVKQPWASGAKKASAIPPGAAGRIGTQEVRTSKPAAAKTIAGSPLGNELATNVGAGGPGKGRTVAPSGSQGRH